jgi:hypothetical protein
MIDNWQGDAFILAVELGFTEANEEINEEIKDETRSVKWDWPRETYRIARGMVAASPRDVIDSGEFLESIHYEYQQLDEGFHKISVTYAQDVVLGIGDKPARNVFQIPIYEHLLPEFQDRVIKYMNQIK